MRKLTKLLSALIVLVLATAFIGCSNPSSSSDGTSGGSSSGGGNSNSSTYTKVAGRKYLNIDSDAGFVFNDDYSVNRVIGDMNSKMSGTKWRIGNGNTVELYAEGNTDYVFDTFTANTDFSQLTCDGVVYIRQ